MTTTPATYDRTTPIDAFAAAAAARQPVPGGGAISALVGALSCAMGEMVLQYTVGKPAVAQQETHLRTLLDQLGRARHLFLQLLLEDQLAFAAMSESGKLPKTDPDREARLTAGLLASIRIPQSIAAAAIAVLDIADSVTEVANIRLLSDLAVCADLAVATVRCAVHNIRANLPMVTDPTERAGIDAAAAQALNRARSVIRGFEPKFQRRVSAGA
jgi:formiminotetrahydrofolate cyclodeaminase